MSKWWCVALVAVLVGCGEPPEPYTVTVYCASAPALVIRNVTSVYRGEDYISINTTDGYSSHSLACEVRR